MRCAETTRVSYGTPSRSSVSAAALHRLPVRLRAHDDADQRFHAADCSIDERLLRAEGFAQQAEQLRGSRRSPRPSAVRARAALDQRPSRLRRRCRDTSAASSLEAPRLPATSGRAIARCAGSAAPRRARARVSRSSAARIGSASILRISLPMYCFCRYRPPCAVILRASSTASRRFSGSGSAFSSESGRSMSASPSDCRSSLRALALALAGAVGRRRTSAERSVAYSCSQDRAFGAVVGLQPRYKSQPMQSTACSNPVACSAQLLAAGSARPRRPRARAKRAGSVRAMRKSASASRPVCPSPRGCGEVETLEYQRDRGMGVTVYRGKRKGSASTGDLSAGAIRDIGREGLQHRRLHRRGRVRGLAGPRHAGARLSRPRSVSSLVDRSGCRRASWRSPARRRRWMPTRASAIPRARRCRVIAGCACSAIRSASSAASPTTVAQPELRRRRRSRRGDAARLLVQHGSRLARSRRRRQHRQAGGSARAASAQRAQACRRVTAPVLFVPELARGLFGSFLGAIRGGSQYRRASFLLDAAGEQVFPEWMQISERPHLRKALEQRAVRQRGRRDARSRDRRGRRAARLRAEHATRPASSD